MNSSRNTILHVMDSTTVTPVEDRMDHGDPDRQFTNAVDHNTTMGAVTLMAFLNLLGYIQVSWALLSSLKFIH